MKWQKNTGAMPCEGEREVKVRFRGGSESIGQAKFWAWYIREASHDIVYYCLPEYVPFDYAEPKVWTVENEGGQPYLYKNKRFYAVFSSALTESEVKVVEAALNAMDGRNGTV
jgi:hypothetical protein